MDVSSSTNISAQTEVDSTKTGKDPIKKAIDVQKQQVLKVLDDLQEQSKKISVHKTGIGNNLNVSA